MLTIPQFCEQHRISNRTYYYLRCRGEAPETIRDGKRNLITEDAATSWRLRNGASKPDGELVEIVTVAAMTALPELVQRLGASAGAIAYYHSLGTLLRAIGVLDGDGTSAAALGE